MRYLILFIVLLFPSQCFADAGFIAELGSAVVENGSCPALTGNLATEDFSGSGLAGTIFESDDANVTDPDDYNDTSITAGCFDGQSFIASGSDHWTRITSWTEPVIYYETDFYLSSESLNDGDEESVISLSNNSPTEIAINIKQASGSLYFSVNFGNGIYQGSDVPAATGVAYRLGLYHNNTTDTGAWVIYSYATESNLDTWSGSVSASLGNNGGGYAGPVNGTSSYTGHFDNVEFDDTGWMQLSP